MEYPDVQSESFARVMKQCTMVSQRVHNFCKKYGNVECGKVSDEDHLKAVALLHDLVQIESSFLGEEVSCSEKDA